MKSNKNMQMIMISGLSVLIGIGILLSSTGWGQNAANAYLRSQPGGSMGTSNFLVLIRGYMTSYRQLGAIILAGGIAGLLVAARSLLS